VPKQKTVIVRIASFQGKATSMSKTELAESLGYIFPNGRVDYQKLFKKVQDTGLLNKLGMTAFTFKRMHKERFSLQQSDVIKKHFNI
jgi:hypothetical protein